MLTTAQIQDEAKFWLNQDREHNLFFMLGLQEPRWRKTAEQLYLDFDQVLRAGDLRQALERVLPKSQEFKTELLRLLEQPGNAGKAGYIWPSFVDHTKREIDHFLRRISPTGLTARDELCHGNQMLSDHAAFASSLVDPVKQRELGDVARAASRATSDLANKCRTETFGTLVALSKGAEDTLNGFLHTPSLKDGAIIHPVLADHVVREGRWFGQLLPRLQE